MDKVNVMMCLGHFVCSARNISELYFFKSEEKNGDQRKCPILKVQSVKRPMRRCSSELYTLRNY